MIGQSPRSTLIQEVVWNIKDVARHCKALQGVLFVWTVTGDLQDEEIYNSLQSRRAHHGSIDKEGRQGSSRKFKEGNALRQSKVLRCADGSWQVALQLLRALQGSYLPS